MRVTRRQLRTNLCEKRKQGKSARTRSLSSESRSEGTGVYRRIGILQIGTAGGINKGELNNTEYVIWLFF